MGLRDDLLSVATAYATAIGRSDATVGRMLFGGPAKLKSLREGADILSRNAEAALQTLSDRWPEGAVWPETVPRPDPQPSPPDAPPVPAASQRRRRRRAP